jgi:hypothetical protein
MVQDVFQPARSNFDSGHFVLSLENSLCMTEQSSRSRYNVAHIEGVLTLTKTNHLYGGYQGSEIKIITRIREWRPITLSMEDNMGHVRSLHWRTRMDQSSPIVSTAMPPTRFARGKGLPQHWVSAHTPYAAQRNLYRSALFQMGSEETSHSDSCSFQQGRITGTTVRRDGLTGRWTQNTSLGLTYLP